MNLKGLVFVLIVLFLSCKKKKEESATHLSYFTNDATALIRINDMARFQSELKNNDFLSTSMKLPFFNSLSPFLHAMEYIKSEASCTLAFYEVGREDFGFVLVSTNLDPIFDLDKAQEKSSETIGYENHTIERIVLDQSVFFATNIPEGIAVSSSQLLLENLIRVKKTNRRPKTLQKLVETADQTKSANFFINLEQGENFIASGLKPARKGNIALFSDWISLDFNTNQNALNLSGITIANDSTKNMVALFKNAPPSSTKTASIAPFNSDAILSYAIGDYTSFAQNQDNYLDRLQQNDTIFNTIEEVGIIYLTNDQKSVVLNSFGTNNLLAHLNSKSNDSFEYQGSEISSLIDKKLISEAFKPLIKNFNSNYFTVLENAFVFSQDRQTLRTIISNQRNKTTFDQSAVYTNAMKSLASESSILFVASASGMNQIFEREFLPEAVNDAHKDHSYAAQLVADNGFYHSSILVSKIQKTITSNSVTPLFNLELDADLAIDPKFVKNHRTNKQEIVVQDTDNNLYLVSTDGKVHWKKRLEGKIQGTISQVDLYKNGKLQLAFCTNDQFLILDRNGDEVPPFNKKFEGGNLNGLAVFDYEGSKNYRFVVTQGSKIFMYNNQGNIVDGFTYTDAGSNILKAPKHFRMEKKDFLVFLLENGDLKIRHRAGQERLKVDTMINFSSNDVFLYKNRFSVTDTKGVLYQIDTKGKITKTNFNLGSDHGMYSTSKTLALMNDNVLSIKGKKVELDLGVYTAPKIFYIYDKIYVSVTDIQNQKIHLYDSQAKPIANFPVYGSSAIDLVDMDNDRKLELVAKDQENSLIVYKMN